MRTSRVSGFTLSAAGVAVAFFLSVTAMARPAGAQTYSVPRTADGTPDLQGVWQVLNTANVNVQDHQATSDGPGGVGVVDGNEIPYQPWALEKKKANFANRLTADPERKCFLPGIPRATYLPFPFEIIQTPRHVFFAYEFAHATRMVYTNGSKHQEDVEFWMGDSRGRWDGDTLVVDVTNHNDHTWFDRAGNFHSEALHVVERFTRTDRDHLSYEVTIEDPKVFTRPWKMRMILYRRAEPNVELLDYQCYAFEENNKGRSVPLSRESTIK